MKYENSGCNIVSAQQMVATFIVTITFAWAIVLSSKLNAYSLHVRIPSLFFCPCSVLNSNQVLTNMSWDWPFFPA